MHIVHAPNMELWKLAVPRALTGTGRKKLNRICKYNSYPNCHSLINVSCNQLRCSCWNGMGRFCVFSFADSGSSCFIFHRPNVFPVEELITPNAKYCTFPFNMGFMPAVYTSITIVCYDVFLVLAAAILVRHFKERRECSMRPNTYMVMVIQYHIMYFVSNLTRPNLNGDVMGSHSNGGNKALILVSSRPVYHQYL
ncbi:hypothetical protein EV702DRAFT_382249 [Suillus placidus]|uniref:Uncharacterized protein n=1 Tax=Suillus placidus TaxID=48579 RepID=A0A9P7A677_9AGAM|nr:hypothetical protein EV702DRAFT_382249 [Suillus placidus]